jgi:Protein of unknown function (DUF2905)
MPPGGLGALGRTLIALGAVVALLGVLLVIADRFPGLRIGKLPGDVSIERDHFRFYFPLGTSIVVSVILSLVLWLIGRRG